MKINRIIHSAIYATKDRRLVNKGLNVGHDELDKIYYNSIKNTSGEPAKSLKEGFTAWKKAYISNMDRFELIDSINRPFKNKKSLLARIFKF